jgi:hypothetical protein
MKLGKLIENCNINIIIHDTKVNYLTLLDVNNTDNTDKSKFFTHNLKSYDSIVYISKSFLLNCHKLVSCDFSEFTTILKIGNSFLKNCSNLKRCNLSGFGNVEEIGTFFLHGCVKLNIIDLSPFINVKKIDKYFMIGCTNLKKIICDDKISNYLKNKLYTCRPLDLDRISMNLVIEKKETEIYPEIINPKCLHLLKDDCDSDYDMDIVIEHSCVEDEWDTC